MRIAWFCIPAYGHTNPTLGLVKEMTDAGHEVYYFTFELFREKVEAAGAVFIVIMVAAVAGVHFLVQRPEAAGVIIADMVGVDHDVSVFLFHFSFPPESFAPLYTERVGK